MPLTQKGKRWEGVVEARSKATQMTVDANDLTPEKLAEYPKSTGRGYFRSRQAARHYRKLSRPESQPELPGAPSPVGRYGKPHQRGTYQLQQCGEEFNTAIRRFPKNILAGLFGLRSVPTLKPPKEANKHLRWSSKETELNIKHPLIRCRTRTDLQVRCRMRGYFLRKAKAISEIITTFVLN